jgi:hypothetical protein
MPQFRIALPFILAVAWLLCAAPGAWAQRLIPPCYRPTTATVAAGQTFNGKLCRDPRGCLCMAQFCPVCGDGPWQTSCTFTTCRPLQAPR